MPIPNVNDKSENIVENIVEYIFDGIWTFTGEIFFTSNDKITTSQTQIMILKIKKIHTKGYLCVFQQVFPIPADSVYTGIEFFVVATQLTQDPNLLQSSGSNGGYNTFYLDNEDNLHVTFVTNVTAGTISGESIFKMAS